MDSLHLRGCVWVRLSLGLARGWVGASCECVVFGVRCVRCVCVLVGEGRASARGARADAVNTWKGGAAQSKRTLHAAAARLLQ
eukprot:7305378-Prymnesium_polylepis.1